MTYVPIGPGGMQGSGGDSGGNDEGGGFGCTPPMAVGLGIALLFIAWVLAMYYGGGM